MENVSHTGELYLPAKSLLCVLGLTLFAMVTFLISVVWYFIYGGKTELLFPCILRRFSEEANESVFTFLKKADILGVLTTSMIRSSKDVL